MPFSSAKLAATSFRASARFASTQTVRCAGRGGVAAGLRSCAAAGATGQQQRNGAR